MKCHKPHAAKDCWSQADKGGNPDATGIKKKKGKGGKGRGKGTE